MQLMVGACSARKLRSTERILPGADGETSRLDRGSAGLASHRAAQRSCGHQFTWRYVNCTQGQVHVEPCQ